MQKFKDLHVFAEKRFSVGIETESGRYFLSIPVSNALVDYEEYYEIDEEVFERCPSNSLELERIAERCRQRLNDERLLLLPGQDRGVAR